MARFDSLALNIATLGPIGRLPGMPGTWGSLAAVLIAPFCFVPFPFWARGIMLLALLLGGIWAAQRADRILGSHDPGCVVIDEVLGQWIALIVLPVPTIIHLAQLWEYALGFLYFRLFDIFKPFPIRQLDRHIPGGLGVMIDDVLAGIFAAVLLYYTPDIVLFTGYRLP